MLNQIAARSARGLTGLGLVALGFPVYYSFSKAPEGSCQSCPSSTSTTTTTRPKYIEALQSGESSVKVTIDSDGNPNLHYPGDYNIAVRGHRDLDYREGRARRARRRPCRCITFTTPGDARRDAGDGGARWRAMVNDAFAQAVESARQHFTSLATLPLNDPAASVEGARTRDGRARAAAARWCSATSTAWRSADERFGRSAKRRTSSAP